MRQSELIRAAYEGKNTLVIKNANVVNVFTDEIVRADVAVYEDVIIGVGSYSGENEIDAGGAYLAPGFIDAHVHIESSMVIPSSFMKVIMPHGTTTVIADPHEIVNVCGSAGLRGPARRGSPARRRRGVHLPYGISGYLAPLYTAAAPCGTACRYRSW